VDSYNFACINFRGRNLNFIDTSLDDCDMLLFVSHFDLVTNLVFMVYFSHFDLVTNLVFRVYFLILIWSQI
jgi:hypothetical protein